MHHCLYSIRSNEGGKLLNNSGKWFSSATILAFLLLCNIGFTVDHIHFQYHGLLTGILLLSIGSMLQVKYLVKLGIIVVVMSAFSTVFSVYKHIKYTRRKR
jgi:alpha-1,3-glucosyltransferase